MSVKVAVRVRPFNPREKALNSKLCVDMQDKTTIIEDEDGKPRTFTFDYSFWSHDGYIEESDGYMRADGSKYADQMSVYKTVGEEVLKNAWDGYHCTLFAYGQTGSGKSYSMIGYGANKGIVPNSSEEIFKRIASSTNPNVVYDVTVSMIEIYNEKIQDLLIDLNDRVKGGLKVRESKTLGVYVEGLTNYSVKNYEEISAKMDEGSRNRSIGATEMNASSSRAHTIITINFMQKITQDKRTTEKISVINLVDLAGSEKASKTGAQGDRLKEGCAINKSLTVLGIVISTLAEKSGGKAKDKVVPFRDSALTRILQNALGGNSKTLMICAISPASNNYEETLSTLRYADQAKKIKCKAVVNESETDKIIREQKEQIEKLKQALMLMAGKGELPKDIDLASILGGAPPKNDDDDDDEDSQDGSQSKQSIKTDVSTAGGSVADEETRKMNELLQLRLRETEEQLNAQKTMMEEFERTFREAQPTQKRVEVSKEVKEKFDPSFPHISNVSEDPQLTGKVCYSFKDTPNIKVGRKNAVGNNEIKLNAMGIQPEHAIFEYEESDGLGLAYISPANENVTMGLYLNGVPVEEKERLYHLDRIVFGTSSAFLYKDYQNAEFKRTELEEKDIDLEYCQLEISNENQQMKELVQVVEEQGKDARLEQTEKKMKETEDELRQYKIKLENLEMDNQRSEKDLEYRQIHAEFEKKKLERDLELEKHRQAIKEKQLNEAKNEKEKKLLGQSLLKYMPMIVESNLMARELRRDISFGPHLAYQFNDPQDVHDDLKDDANKMPILKVRVDNHEAGFYYMWDIEKFFSRYFMIKEMLDEYFGSNEIPVITEEKDPFWDPPEPQLIGQGFFKLLSIAYLLDGPTELVMVDDKGKTGTLNVNLLPATETGEPLDPDMLVEEELISDPRELEGRRLDFVVDINSSQILNKELVDFFCTYTLLNDNKEKETFRTEAKVPQNGEVEFNYRKHHFFTTVDDQTLNYLLTSNLKFEIYGNEARKPVPVKKTTDKKPEQTAHSPMSLSETKPGQQTPKMVQTQVNVPVTNGNHVAPATIPKPKTTQVAPVADQPPKAKKGSTSAAQTKDKDCNLI